MSWKFSRKFREALSNYCLSEYNQHFHDIPSNYISMQCQKNPKCVLIFPSRWQYIIYFVIYPISCSEKDVQTYRKKQGDCHANISQLTQVDTYKYHCDDCEMILEVLLKKIITYFCSYKKSRDFFSFSFFLQYGSFIDHILELIQYNFQ